MNRLRRELLTAALGAALPWPLRAQPVPAARVVIIGGGFGGASCARALRRVAPQVQVTLIEPRAHFYTGPWTNAAITGACATGDIVQSPAGLRDIGVEPHWYMDRPSWATPISPLAVNGDLTHFPSQVEILKSSDLIKTVAERLDLASRPEFDPAAKMSVVSEILVGLGLKKSPLDTPPGERVLKRFSEKLDVYVVPSSRIIAIIVSKDDIRHINWYP